LRARLRKLVAGYFTPPFPFEISIGLGFLGDFWMAGRENLRPKKFSPSAVVGHVFGQLPAVIGIVSA
jgi:hypothetical protein